MEALFLGTSSMVPTKDRNHAGVFVSHGNEGILLDCGEGTQRQLKIAGISLSKITRILITHWHGDHVLGLLGLMQTMGSLDYPRTLLIYGPKGTEKRLKLMQKAFVFEDRLDYKVHDIKKRVFFEADDFLLEALPLDHTTPCLGFNVVQKDRRRIKMDKVKRLGLEQGPLIGQLQEGHSINWKGKTVKPDEVSFVEKGKKLSYITDTAYCNNAVELAKDADVLICESTYAHDLEEKAMKYKHLTGRHAAMIATKANVKKLVLTHFSQRYKSIGQIEEDAKEVFPEIVCANDFTRIRV